MLNLKDYRSQAKGLADLLPYAGLIDKGIVLNKDGSFTAAWYCRGQDTFSMTAEDLNFITFHCNQAAKLLGSGWLLHMDAVRSSRNAYASSFANSDFPDPISRMIEDERRQRFTSGICHTTTTVLCLTYKPEYYASRLANSAESGVARGFGLERHLQAFKNSLREVAGPLSSILHLERLEEYSETDSSGASRICSDLLSYLQQCLTGEYHPVRVPVVPMYLDALLGSEELVGGMEPRLGKRWMAVLSIDGFPPESRPAMLDILNALPIPYRWSTRFLFLDQYDAKQEGENYRKGWNQQVFRFVDRFFNNPNARPNLDAIRMVQDADQAITEIQGGYVGAGYITSSLVLLNEDPEILGSHAQDLRREIRSLGFGCRIETQNALEAWLGTHPGNGFANLRKSLVNTVNLSHLLPLSDVWSGRDTCPCPFFPSGSPPLMVVTTEGQTPLWFNLHVGDVGHSLIFGPTGAGKSTLLALIAAQFLRYPNAQIFAFDKGLSLLPLCLAVKGTHYELGGNAEDANARGRGLALAPLQHIDTPQDRAWAAEWLATLLGLQGITVLPGHTNDIHEGLTRLQSRSRDLRDLKEFYDLVPSVEIREGIRHYTSLGDMGHLLDSQHDTLGLSSFTVFEIEDLMNMGEKNLLPVLLYIFRRMEKALDGRPSLLILDEAWIMLGHPVFRAKIREWLKVLRKKNCAVVLSTQSLSDAKRSGIMDVLAESCPTKILLPNKAALQEDQMQAYLDIGCNRQMIEHIVNAAPKKDYYLISTEGRRMIRLALGEKALAFVGASDPESIAAIRKLRQEYGPDEWQKVWLKKRGAA
jgi:type IV secretion system protein VirB4